MEFVIPVCEKLRKENYCEFEASQDCVVKPCLKKQPPSPHAGSVKLNGNNWANDS